MPFNNTPSLTLFQLNNLVRQVIELSMTEEYWVTAELSGVHENRGHCYMELVEKDDNSNTPVAQARACCWRNTWARLSPRFMNATGQPLHSGQKVLLRLQANFHEAYGFSWIVTDIDPSYTMGDMARRRQEILKALQEQGVADMNKTLPIPLFAQRIAVISSATAAGYGDFRAQLSNNEYGFKFTTQLFPAIMQGEMVQDSIIQALESINRQADAFDVVVIIRGGGSTADLSGFDTLPLAENVANFPLPVITGIGHERDRSVLDIIACVSQKTPTAVATFLIAHLADTLNLINDCATRISHCVTMRMQEEQMTLQRMEQRLAYSVSNRMLTERNRIENITQRLSHAAQNRMQRECNRLDMLAQRLPWLCATRMEREHNRLNILAQRVAALDPINILKRGYSITLLNGKAVTEAAQLTTGDKISIVLAAGTTEATVD